MINHDEPEWLPALALVHVKELLPCMLWN